MKERKGIIDRLVDFLDKQVKKLWLRIIIWQCRRYDKLKTKLFVQYSRLDDLLDRFEEVYGVDLRKEYGKR